MDLSDQLAPLWRWMPGLVLVMARVGALFFTAPLIGGPFVPSRVKTLLTLAIGVLLMPTVEPLLPAEMPTDLRYVLMLAQELAVGASVGFACTCIFEGVRAGGVLINRYAGFTAAENFDPESSVGEGPVGDLMLIGMVMVFLAADTHLHLIAIISTSFAAVPVGAWNMSPQLLHMAASGTDLCVATACMISFPVLAVIMLIVVAEGMIAKAVPQINILFISFSVKILASILVLYAGMPAMIGFMGMAINAIHRLVDASIVAI